MASEPLNRRLDLRLTTPQLAELEALAHVRHSTVSDLIRERIDVGAMLEQRFEALRRELLSLPASRAAGPRTPSGQPLVDNGNDGLGSAGPILIEMLLLLRTMARPQHLHDAQGAVDRLGLTLWTGEERR